MNLLQICALQAGYLKPKMKNGEADKHPMLTENWTRIETYHVSRTDWKKYHTQTWQEHQSGKQ